MQQVRINDVKRGDFIKRKADSLKVYVKGEYDRATKRYSLIDAEDISRELFIKPGTFVFVGFTY